MRVCMSQFVFVCVRVRVCMRACVCMYVHLCITARACLHVSGWHLRMYVCGVSVGVFLFVF